MNNDQKIPILVGVTGHRNIPAKERTAIRRSVTEELRKLQEETAWVLDALCALTAGDAPEAAHDIRACWVYAQREYHRKASESAGQKLSTSDRTVRFALFLSVGLYLLGVGYDTNTR